ncbi:hypothetical protein GR7B_00013 [Vibrio phage vB_VcorM_GR7B]|nr:hypothetical protein GR7B_00013 [Vibrio phage vB_VcorM_GR7B]
MNKKCIPHIYDVYPLYGLMYGRPQFYKSYDNWKLLQALDTYKQLKDSSIGTPSLKVFETFAGISEHREDFIRVCPYPVREYQTMDIIKSSPDVWQGDACLDEYPEDCDIIVAHYHSLPCILPNKDYTARELVVSMFKRVKEALDKSGGIFFLHVGDPDGGSGVLNHVETKVSKRYIESHHPIRDYLEQGGTSSLYMESTESSEYDLWTNTMKTWLKFRFYTDETKSAQISRINVEQPWTQRIWSYYEVLECAAEAGFTQDNTMCFNVPERSLNRYEYGINLVDLDVTSDSKLHTKVPTDILFHV